MKDYQEMYLKEKMLRLRAESELLVLRHEKAINEHTKTQEELNKYMSERMAVNTAAGAKTVEEPKKRTYKRKTKNEGK